MYYSRWASESEIQEKCIEQSKSDKFDKAGIPLIYNKDKIYSLNSNYNTLIIGSEGSGKTQVTTLPLINSAISAGESIVINDFNNDIFKVVSKSLEENGYEIININFSNSDSKNTFNPLDIPYKLFKSDNDKALKMIEDIGYYLLNDGKIVGDPFWENTAIDYFCGLVLYLFEQDDETQININGVYNLSNSIENRKEFINAIDKNSNVYAYLTGTLTAPDETYGSILSVFHQKMRRYIVGDNLKNMLSKSDFNLMNIKDKKQAIFIVSGTNSYSDHLIPLIYHQIYDIKEINDKGKQYIRMIIDEFDSLIPFHNIIKTLNYARKLDINFTITIKSFTNLISLYGKEIFEMMKLCFSNIIYLLSNDLYTLKEISEYCGNTLNKNKVESLISLDELKRLKQFEAIILVLRCMPYRIILEPYCKINKNM